MRLIAILAGGALGTLARYALSVLAHHRLGTGFPWGTLAVNLAGCFLIGLLWAWADRAPFPPLLASFTFIGFLGAFTTFSTYGLETVNLARGGDAMKALANVAVSNGLGLIAVLAGFLAFRLFLALLRPGAL